MFVSLHMCLWTCLSLMKRPLRVAVLTVKSLHHSEVLVKNMDSGGRLWILGKILYLFMPFL